MTRAAIGVLYRDGAVTAICAHRTNLERLPEAIGELASLERLDVGGNRLSELPALPASLRELYVHDNQLVRLPALPACPRRVRVCPEWPMGSSRVMIVIPVCATSTSGRDPCTALPTGPCGGG